MLYLADRPGQHRGQRQAVAAGTDGRDGYHGDHDRYDRTTTTCDCDPDEGTADDQQYRRYRQPGDRAGQPGCPQYVTAHSHAPPSGHCRSGQWDDDDVPAGA